MNAIVRGKLIALGFIILALVISGLLSGCSSPETEIILVDRDTGEIVEPTEPYSQTPRADCQEDGAYWRGMADIYTDMADVLKSLEDDVSDDAIRTILASHSSGLRRMKALNPPTCAVRLHSLQVEQIGYYNEAYRALLDYDFDSADFWWGKSESLDPLIDAEYDKIEAQSYNASSNVSY